MNTLKKLMAACVVLAMTAAALPVMGVLAAPGESDAPQTTGMNLVTNGSFEDGLSGWTTNAEGGLTVTPLDGGGRDGTDAVQIVQEGSAQSRYLTQTEKVTLEKNVLYEVSVWVKIDQAMKDNRLPINIKTDAFAAHITDRYDGNGSVVSSDTDMEYEKTRYLAANNCENLTVGEWTQLKGYYRYNGTWDDGSTKFWVSINNDGTAGSDITFALDDFSVRRCEEPENILIDYTKDGVSNPWFANGSTASYAKVETMQDHAGEQSDVLVFTSKNEGDAISPGQQPILFEKNQPYQVSFWAKLNGGAARQEANLEALISYRGYLDTNTGYIGTTTINNEEWTYVSKTFTYTNFAEQGGGNFFFRTKHESNSFNKNTLDICIDGLTFTEQGIVSNGTFETDVSGWNDPSHYMSWQAGGADGSAGAALINAETQTNHNLNTHMKINLEREKWYRFSAQVKLAPDETEPTNAQIYLTEVPEWKWNYNNSTWGWHPYMVIADGVQVNNNEWTTIAGYYKNSGMEKHPETGEPITDAGGQLQIRVGSGVTNISYLIDNVEVEEIDTIVANGDLEDEYFKNNPDSKGRVADTAFGTTFKPFNPNNELLEISEDAAHSGNYGGKSLNATKNQRPTNTAMAQYLHFDLDQWYEISAWVKADVPADLQDNQTLRARFLFTTNTFIDKDIMRDYQPDKVLELEDAPERVSEAYRIDRQVADLGTVYPAVVDVTDGEWHQISCIFNPAQITARDYDNKTLAELGATVAAGTFSTRVQLYTDNSEDQNTGIDFCFDDFEVHPIAGNTVSAETEVVQNDSSLSASVCVTNTTATDFENVSVLIPVYRADGTLSRVEMQSAPISAVTSIGNSMTENRGIKNFDFSLTLSEEERGGFIKVFVWDGLETLKPLTGGTAYELN